MADRAVIYVDGNNWYHSISDLGVKNLGRLDYAKISTKLVRARQWIATRYHSVAFHRPAIRLCTPINGAS